MVMQDWRQNMFHILAAFVRRLWFPRSPFRLFALAQPGARLAEDYPAVRPWLERCCVKSFAQLYVGVVAELINGDRRVSLNNPYAIVER